MDYNSNNLYFQGHYSDPNIYDLSEDGTVEVIIKFYGDIANIRNALGVEVEQITNNYAIVSIPPNRIYELVSLPQVEYIEPPKTLVLQVYNNRNTTCVSQVQQANSVNLTGTGTIIGIIDSGIDYTHPDFRNKDGTTRILSIWDQTISGTPPEGFSYGAEYSNTQINEALKSETPYDIVPSRDIVGHGTAVAGIATGNGASSNGRYRGISFESNLIIVKMGERGTNLFVKSTEIVRAIKYIVDKSTVLNMPVSINISYGTNNGSHDGNSLFESLIDTLSEQWKTCITVPTGNEGYSGHHFSGKVNTGETISVDITSRGSFNISYLSLWSNFNDQLNFELIAPNGDTTGIFNATTRGGVFFLNGSRVTVVFDQPNQYTTNQELFIHANGQSDNLSAGIWSLKVTGVEIVDGKFDVWLPTIEDVGTDIAFLSPSVNLTITLPSTASRVISVSGYDSQTKIIAQFSGRGFTRNNVYIKPDLAAPAVDIYSTRTGGGYDTYTGTSFAGPFVTGAAALLMEWGVVRRNDSGMFGQRVKAFLTRGATRDPNVHYPNASWGYGTLCLSRSLEHAIRYSQGGR